MFIFSTQQHIIASTCRLVLIVIEVSDKFESNLLLNVNAFLILTQKEMRNIQNCAWLRSAIWNLKKFTSSNFIQHLKCRRCYLKRIESGGCSPLGCFGFFFLLLRKVGFNSCWSCSCPTSHVNLNETILMKKAEYISWRQNIQYRTKKKNPPRWNSTPPDQ